MTAQNWHMCPACGENSILFRTISNPLGLCPQCYAMRNKEPEGDMKCKWCGSDACIDTNCVIRERHSLGLTTVKVNMDEYHVVTASPNTKQVGGDHYKNKAIQPWDFISSNNIGFLEGNAIKYLARWKEKGGLQDIEKAQHYIEKLLEIERAKS